MAALGSACIEESVECEDPVDVAVSDSAKASLRTIRSSPSPSPVRSLPSKPVSAAELSFGTWMRGSSDTRHGLLNDRHPPPAAGFGPRSSPFQSSILKSPTLQITSSQSLPVTKVPTLSSSAQIVSSSGASTSHSSRQQPVDTPPSIVPYHLVDIEVELRQGCHDILLKGRVGVVRSIDKNMAMVQIKNSSDITIPHESLQPLTPRPSDTVKVIGGSDSVLGLIGTLVSTIGKDGVIQFLSHNKQRRKNPAQIPLSLLGRYAPKSKFASGLPLSGAFFQNNIGVVGKSPRATTEDEAAPLVYPLIYAVPTTKLQTSLGPFFSSGGQQASTSGTRQTSFSSSSKPNPSNPLFVESAKNRPSQICSRGGGGGRPWLAGDEQVDHIASRPGSTGLFQLGGNSRKSLEVDRIGGRPGSALCKSGSPGHSSASQGKNSVTKSGDKLFQSNSPDNSRRAKSSQWGKSSSPGRSSMSPSVTRSAVASGLFPAAKGILSNESSGTKQTESSVSADGRSPSSHLHFESGSGSIATGRKALPLESRGRTFRMVNARPSKTSGSQCGNRSSHNEGGGIRSDEHMQSKSSQFIRSLGNPGKSPSSHLHLERESGSKATGKGVSPLESGARTLGMFTTSTSSSQMGTNGNKSLRMEGGGVRSAESDSLRRSSQFIRSLGHPGMSLCQFVGERRPNGDSGISSRGSSNAVGRNTKGDSGISSGGSGDAISNAIIRIREGDSGISNRGSGNAISRIREGDSGISNRGSTNAVGKKREENHLPDSTTNGTERDSVYAPPSPKRPCVHTTPPITTAAAVHSNTVTNSTSDNQSSKFNWNQIWTGQAAWAQSHSSSSSYAQSHSSSSSYAPYFFPSHNVSPQTRAMLFLNDAWGGGSGNGIGVGRGGFLKRRPGSMTSVAGGSRDANVSEVLENLVKDQQNYAFELASPSTPGGGSHDIKTSCVRVSLICPLSQQRMKYPSRGKACKHLQCFDAENYINFHEKQKMRKKMKQMGHYSKPMLDKKWNCPICERITYIPQLYIDKALMKLVNESSVTTEVELSRNGSWVPVTKSAEVEVIDLTDD